MSDYTDYDGIGLASLISKKEISIPELLESVISRIERLNPMLNAVVYELFDQARTTAAGLEKQMYEEGTDFEPGLLYGIPFLIKNLLADCKDTPFSDGSRFVEGYLSPIDSELMRRYKKAGLVICGRTNASELGVQPAAEPALFGPTHNPWNLEYSTGGSSGGAAAAVAAGIVPIAHGNDGGGSLRIPASCCGLFSLKPNRARIPLGPLFGDFASGMVCEHVLTRSVRDSAAMLDISHGTEAGDPYNAPYFSGSYLGAINRPPGKLKIALLTEVPGGWCEQKEIHPDCINAAHEAARLCENMGHQVDIVKPDELSWPGLADLFLKRFCGFVGHCVNYWERTLGKRAEESEFEPATWELYQAGLKISAGEYLSAMEGMQLFSRKIARWYRDGKWDLLLSPTMMIPPVKTGAFSPNPDNPQQWIINAVSFAALTRIQNITGQPAVSIPLFTNNAGLPIGVQFAGSAGSEDLLLGFSARIEEAHPWFKNYPAIYPK